MEKCSCPADKPIQLKVLWKTEPPPAWSCGTLQTPAGRVFQISTEWSREDRWGQIKSRISAFRMKYSVKPGLYAVNNPGEISPVLVSANYKLSFDVLRRELTGIDAWVLVLDTKGINVWCAAGKGTFGTVELIRAIRESHLDRIVNHKKVILPQLGAPGVNAADVRKETGFRVSFGPVRAKDIPAYISAGYSATKEMRTVRFTVLDRLVLTPMEINPAMKKYPLFALIILLIMGLQPTGILFRDLWLGGAPFLLLGFSAVMTGAFFTPVMLPMIPFRSFAVKGWIAGTIAMLILASPFDVLRQNTALLLAAYLFFPLASSYIALQFTGSTTFTNMSGVRKELKIGVPIYLIGTGISLALVILFKLKEWGVV
ncbi:MAG: mercury methylation corrinoid protein HgcA [bacterium]